MESPEFVKLIDNCAFTVGELIEKLSKFPKETKLCCDGPDCGGYDVDTQPYVGIKVIANNEIMFTHYGGRAWLLYQDKLITEEEYKKLAPN